MYIRLFYIIITSCCLLSCSQQKLFITEHRQQQYTISGAAAPDSALTAFLSPYKRGVDTQMQVVIGHTDIPLTKAQPECTLGNLVADATLAAAQKLDKRVVAAVSNYGGIRLTYLAPGPITRGKIYELMPFDNMLTIMEVPGKVLQQFCDAMALRKGWPVSGLSFVIKDGKATDIMVGAAPLKEALVYKIALSDYVAHGGDNCDFLQGLPKRNTTFFIRDAIIEYVAAQEMQGKAVHPELEQRVRYAE